MPIVIQACRRRGLWEEPVSPIYSAITSQRHLYIQALINEDSHPKRAEFIHGRTVVHFHMPGSSAHCSAQPASRGKEYCGTNGTSAVGRISHRYARARSTLTLVDIWWARFGRWDLQRGKLQSTLQPGRVDASHVSRPLKD